MTAPDRRRFMQLVGSGAFAAALSESIHRALAIPASTRSGTIEDVEHIVVLMQENRSFDHYFGTLRGVRGYDDPRAVTLPSGNPVWFQPDGEGYVLPFHPTAHDLGLQFLEDLAHDWTTTHAAWNDGNYDQWVPSKGPVTMAHLQRHDIPFHYALADAFTVCDAYHCSMLGPTDPNRYHMWTGYVGNDGRGGGPVVDNAEAGYSWTTFPERLLNAGITWKIYQDSGLGLDKKGDWGYTGNAYIGNYGDNALLYFDKYRHAEPGSPLYELARTGTQVENGGTLFDILISDVVNDTLPQVSWIVAPEAYSEHPNWPANYGAWYVSKVLDALTSKPKVWSKTVVFVCYDENDGFFDHMVPATPPINRTQGLSTVDVSEELFAGNSGYPAGPYGLGPRVPMLVISPWSKGGYVNSQVFDHTSIIRFIERRFGSANPALTEHNITKWRRTITGDLTSTFNFKSPNSRQVPLPGTKRYEPKDENRHPSYVPTPPAEQKLPRQEKGQRFARAVPYEFDVVGNADLTAGTFEIVFGNPGAAGAVFQVRAGDGAGGPWSYTVGAGRALRDILASVAGGQSSYNLSVYGPNGYFRGFSGGLESGTNADLAVHVAYDPDRIGLKLLVTNNASQTCAITVVNIYTAETAGQSLAPGDKFEKYWPLAELYGWYDFVLTVDIDASFRQQLAGHVETGHDSASDPAIGGRVAG